MLYIHYSNTKTLLKVKSTHNNTIIKHLGNAYYSFNWDWTRVHLFFLFFLFDCITKFWFYFQTDVKFDEDRINAFICDVVNDDLSEKINPCSVDIITLVRINGQYISIWTFFVSLFHICKILSCMNNCHFSTDFYALCGFSPENAADVKES